ncbi:3996_t:CDS:2, partial [Ambispora leptoticha]
MPPRTLSTALDVKIEAGQPPHIKIFRAHSVVLCARSPYLQAELATLSNMPNPLIKIPFIAPNIMEILLKYMYHNKLTLNSDHIEYILDLLVAGHDLGLQALCEELQLYLIQKKSLLLLQNFAQTRRIAYQHEAFKRLQIFCEQVISNYPETVFMAKDFVLLDRQTLLSLLQRDDLTVKEINIWQRVIEWGIAHTFNINSLNFSSEWTPEQFASLQVTLAEFLPLVRIFQISAVDLHARVFPFESILPNQVVEDL